MFKNLVYFFETETLMEEKHRTERVTKEYDDE